MNHNGVIALPTDGASTYVAGQAIGVNSSGQADTPAASNQIGVVLHDVDATESARPVDVHLFSGGGIILATAGGAISIGAAVGYGAAATKVTAGGALSIGYALEEATADGDIIRVVVA